MINWKKPRTDSSRSWMISLWTWTTNASWSPTWRKSKRSLIRYEFIVSSAKSQRWEKMTSSTKKKKKNVGELLIQWLILHLHMFSKIQ